MLHENIHDVIVERLKKAYGQVPIGDPLEGDNIIMLAGRNILPIVYKCYP